MDETIKIRAVEIIAEFRRCIELQREAFHLPDLEISPVRHLIVTNNCGGFTLGAFAGEKLVGFVHHLVAVRGAGEVIGYSHMAAVAPAFQSAGIGARLKWAQREEALRRGQKFIKWTFDPMQSRNAHFNLNRLGAVVRRYAANYYGTDYNTTQNDFAAANGLDSDRLFAEWQLDSDRVKSAETGELQNFGGEFVRAVKIPTNWKAIIENDLPRARAEQTRVRAEFQDAFAANLICAGFERDAETSKYLLFRI